MFSFIFITYCPKNLDKLVWLYCVLFCLNKLLENPIKRWPACAPAEVDRHPCVNWYRPTHGLWRGTPFTSQLIEHILETSIASDPYFCSVNYRVEPLSVGAPFVTRTWFLCVATHALYYVVCFALPAVSKRYLVQRHWPILIWDNPPVISWQIHLTLCCCPSIQWKWKHKRLNFFYKWKERRKAMGISAVYVTWRRIAGRLWLKIEIAWKDFYHFCLRNSGKECDLDSQGDLTIS
jgi:hypothetical protein